jgi:hypothetical protein
MQFHINQHRCYKNRNKIYYIITIQVVTYKNLIIEHYKEKEVLIMIITNHRH